MVVFDNHVREGGGPLRGLFDGGCLDHQGGSYSGQGGWAIKSNVYRGQVGYQETNWREGGWAV